jgi:hypothetical protein
LDKAVVQSLKHVLVSSGGQRFAASSITTDFRAVWPAPTTEAKLKKSIVRTVIQDLVTDLDDEDSGSSCCRQMSTLKQDCSLYINPRIFVARRRGS